MDGAPPADEGGSVSRRILVTGAAGFMGSRVARWLAARPDVGEVIAVDVAAGPPAGDGVRAVRRDVADGLADLLEGVDAVVHHAFVLRPPRDLQAAARVNVTATARLAEDAATAGVRRIVYPSSTTVYGAWPGTGLHTEDEAPRPVPGFTYSEHKVAAERLLLDAAARGGPGVVVLRGCVVTGPGSDNFILSSLALPVFPVPRGANPDMQFLHVDDYVAAVGAALETPATGIYNVAGAGTISLRTLAAMLGTRVTVVPEGVLRRVVEWSWRLRLQNRSPAPGLAFISHPWLGSIDRIGAEMGWRPDRTSREAVAAWAADR
jgi:UDP-glucose 4-epimerase